MSVPASLVTHTSLSGKTFTRIPAMTDLSTQQHSLSFPAAPTSALRFPARMMKYLFRSRRTRNVDISYANEHLLRDTGMTRSHDVRPIASLGRLW